LHSYTITTTNKTRSTQQYLVHTKSRQYLTATLQHNPVPAQGSPSHDTWCTNVPVTIDRTFPTGIQVSLYCNTHCHPPFSPHPLPTL
jgi:hypothetical protein